MGKVFLYSTSSSCELFPCRLPQNRRLLRRRGEIFVLVILKLSWLVLLHFLLHHQEKKEEEEQEQKLKRKRRKIKISQGVKLKKFFNEIRWSCSCSSLTLFNLSSLQCVYLFKKILMKFSPACLINMARLKLEGKSSRQGFTSLSFLRNFVLELSTQSSVSVSLEISISNITFMPSLARCRQDWLDCQLREMTENSKTKIFAVVVGCSREQKETSFETKWNLLQLERYFVNNSIETLVERLNEWKMIIALKSSMKIS